MMKTRHVPFTLLGRISIPYHRRLVLEEAPACGAPSEGAGYARMWHTVTCERCSSLPSFRRMKSFYEKIGRGRSICYIDVNISVFDKTNINQISVNDAIHVEEWPWMPGQYFIHIFADHLVLGVEAWDGSRTGDKDFYYKAIKEMGFPYHIKKFGTEFSNNCTIVNSFDVISGKTSRTFAFGNDIFTFQLDDDQINN